MSHKTGCRSTSSSLDSNDDARLRIEVDGERSIQGADGDPRSERVAGTSKITVDQKDPFHLDRADEPMRTSCRAERVDHDALGDSRIDARR